MPAVDHDSNFSVIPSFDPASRPAVSVAGSVPSSATAVGIPVARTGPVPDALGLSRERLAAAGFTGEVGSAFVVAATAGPVLVAVGTGEPGRLDAASMRDAAAALARAASTHAHLALHLGAAQVPLETAAQAAVEGALLARYRYDPLRGAPRGTKLESLALVVTPAQIADVEAGARRGAVFAWAQSLARDLANTPHSHMNATRIAELSVALGKRLGIGVEVFDKEALVALGCGGLLGVNAGSAEPPRMVKLTYRPAKASGHLGMVGKGLMYDSGGISLKPSDPIHAQMKNDMSGAAAVLASICAVAELGGDTAITGYLMCTDNMPSGTAMALGDVLTMRGGTKVEVIDTDAEGRLVMADALVLAREEGVDAIVDIATLTGSCARALGPDMAGVVGNDPRMVDAVKAAANATGELVWELPLHRPYRRMLASGVADLQNCAPIGKPDAILASIFLAEFVGDVPWAHIDICGTAQVDADDGWKTAGCSGFGTRLLAELALRFAPVGASR
jgi:leucyl aminopeptidase